jgi:hypothetical protein
MAWLVLVAILLQGLLVPALSLHMAVALPSPMAALERPCSATATTDAGDPSTPVPVPAEHHAADCCLACQGAAAPLLPPAVPAITAPSVAPARAALPASDPPQAPGVVLPYAPRAPPRA